MKCAVKGSSVARHDDAAHMQLLGTKTFFKKNDGKDLVNPFDHNDHRRFK